MKPPNTFSLNIQSIHPHKEIFPKGIETTFLLYPFLNSNACFPTSPSKNLGNLF